jgi:UDP-N-acetylglucosamine 2-epimerase (hydrolysing)
MEAPYYGIPTINLGNRQNQRAKLKSIINCGYEYTKILNCIKKISKEKKFEQSFFFGLGNSKDKFLNALRSKRIWNLNNQKTFKEVSL